MAKITTPSIDETTAPAAPPMSSQEEEIDIYRVLLAGMNEEERATMGVFFNNLLGNRCAELNGSRSEHIQQSIGFHRNALELLTPENDPAEWATVQNNLGLDYLDPASGDPAKNVELAIDCFEKALAVCTRETTPRAWAWSKHNLANSYSQRVQGRRAENLEHAIELYNEALVVRTRNEYPEDWAATTDDLGSAYTNRILGDRAENLEQAIELLHSALEVRTREKLPRQWAITCNKLGIAYLFRIRKDKKENLEKASEMLTPVLEIWTRDSNPTGYAETSLNLGNVHYKLGHLEDAIIHYRNAGEAIAREDDPTLWAKALTCLGSAWQQRIEGNRFENLGKSIQYFESALPAITDPFLRAHTQNNLANSLRMRSRGLAGNDRSRARKLYHKALRVLTLEAVPADHLQTREALGRMEFHDRNWEQAHQAFSGALAARDLLYTAGATTEARQHVLAETAGIPALDACCLARLDRAEEGIEVLELSRARALREILARREAALELASAEHRDAFLAVSSRIANLEAEARAENVPGAAPSRGFLAISADLRTARQELAKIFEQIRACIPELMPVEPDFPEIAEAASLSGMPIVYLATVPEGSLALVVPPAAAARTFWLPGFTTADLDALLFDAEERRYLIGTVLDDQKALKKSLDAAWSGLGKTLLAPLARMLAAEGWTRAALIATGTLDLLPLPSMAPSEVLFTTIPSARALGAACRSLRRRSGAEPVFLGIGDPLLSGAKSLAFAAREVEAAAQLFPEANRRLLIREQATLGAVQEALRGATHLHFACHGKFDPVSPLDSALLLSGWERLTWRSLLDGNLDLSTARLAVLSACQTGIKEYQKAPDEVVGFPTAFLQAGVPCVLASLWPVPDLCTGILMEEFYARHIGRDIAPAEALRDAQHHLMTLTNADLVTYLEKAAQTDAAGVIRDLALRGRNLAEAQRDQCPFAHPWNWAGFVLYGV